jgi:hypothetical protein
MDSTKKNARVAGLLYLSFGPAVFSLIYVPRTLIVRGNATATANNILAHETLFRLGIVGGLLVYRSGFIPRILGVWLIINCFAYLAISFTALLLPDYREVVSRAVMPALLGELAIVLWLLIMGAKEQPLDD